MLHYLTYIITVPLTIFAILFAFSNSGDVTFYVWPGDDALSHTVPVWALGLGFLGVGFFCGALFVWILDQKTRFRYWRESRRAARLEKELDRLHAAQEKTQDALTSQPSPFADAAAPARIAAK